MEPITLRDGGSHLARLLNHSPVTAARNGVLNMLYDALTSANPPVPMYEELATAAAPLCAALGVPDLESVPDALCALEGRPPRAVAAAVRSPELVTAMRDSLDMLDLPSLASRVAQWGPMNPADPPSSALPLSKAGRAARGELVAQLRERTAELMAEWIRVDVQMCPGAATDGRARAAAARAWQVPMITGSVPALPQASAALHPNRLGRTAAVVAYSSLPKAMSDACSAPSRWVFEAVALLVAVGESLRPENWMPGAWGSRDGSARVAVRTGESISLESHGPDAWWPVFDAWGTHQVRIAKSIPTAWKLTTVEADVVVWALCSAAVRLATAASAPLKMLGRSVVEPVDPWPAHRDVELPRWTQGARSVWALMQSARPFQEWTAWPELMTPELGVDHSWPWS
jgi:hypothetical protein